MRTATSAIRAATRSMAEWMASEMMLTEPLSMPAIIFMTIRLILEQTETKAALVFLVMGYPYSR